MWRRFLVVAVVLTVAGCGDSGADTSATSATAPPDTSVATTAGGSVCPGSPLSGTVERTVEAETSSGTHVVAARSDDEIASAYAYSFGDGATYTVYLGDYQIDADAVGSDTLTAPDGGLLVTIFIQATEQLSAGSVVDLRFVPIVDTGGGAEISGFGADEVVGGITITGLDDERICFQIDTSDPQQQLQGVVSAEIVG